MHFEILTKALIICFVMHFQGTLSKIHLNCRILPNPKTQNVTESEVVWNKTSSTPQEYQTLFCTRRCRHGAVVGNSSLLGNNATVQCFDCECERPACEIYGICCPDASDLNATSGSTTSDNQSAITTASHQGNGSLSAPVVMCDTKSSYNKSFLVIRSCNSAYIDDVETVRLCENDVPDNETTTDIYGRVLDSTTDVVYFNRFCAMCNGVDKPIQWQMVVNCKNFLETYKAEDEDAMLRLVLQDKDKCYIRQESPIETTTFECYTDEYKSNTAMIKSCNTSDPKQLNDEDVARACIDIKSVTSRVYGRYTLLYYQNIFCAICRMKSYPRVPITDYCLDTKDVPHENIFILLLNSRTISSKARKQICSDNSWFAPIGECLDLHCTQGKRLQNGNCTSVFTNIKGLGYILRFWLVPGGNHTNVGVAITGIITEIRKLLDYISEAYSMVIEAKVTMPVEGFHELIASSVILIHAQIIASYNLTRDEFETDIVRTFLQESIDIKFDENVNFTLTLRPSVPLGHLQYKSICDTDRNNSLYTTSCNQTHAVSSRYKSIGTITQRSCQFLNVTGTLTCSYLRFRKPDYLVHVDQTELPPRVTVTIDLNGTELNLTDAADLNMVELDNDDALNVCRDILDARLREVKPSELHTLSGVSSAAQYYLSMMCVAASVFCLVLTILTYLRFSVLRSAPGINNIFLSLSLLVSQLSLVASNHVTGPWYLCTAVGILTHFLWLWMFSWTFICSFHMFRVFSSKTAKLSTPKDGSTVRVSKNIIFSLIPPSLIAITVIVTSIFTSNTPGYGKNRCYLDSPVLVGAAMVGPLAVIILCNLVFFVTTVVNISKVRMLEAYRATDDYNNLYVYIKLSTLTGGFWIVGIAAEASDNDVLRFISIVLNGLQGVFIFVSYSCNKRVLRLCTAKSVLKSKGSAPQQNTAETHVD